jgi:hypothetical protein
MSRLMHLFVPVLALSLLSACDSGPSFVMPESATTNTGSFPVARIAARTTLPEGTVVGLTHSFTPGETGTWHRTKVRNGTVAAFITAASCFNGEQPSGEIWVAFTHTSQDDALGSGTYAWPADVCSALEH